MRAKTKTPDKLQGLEGQLRTLEEQHRRAADAILAADNRRMEIEGRQEELAVAVVTGDLAATQEAGELEEALLIETRRAATARTAARKLEAEIQQAREGVDAEQRRIHRRRVDELQAARREVEQVAEGLLEQLMDTLRRAADLDGQTRLEAMAAGGEISRAAQQVPSFSAREWITSRVRRG